MGVPKGSDTVIFFFHIVTSVSCYFYFIILNLTFLQGFTDDQLVLVERNTLMVEEREREIRQVVQSISDLNEIFRDLGAMIVEQVHKPTVKVLIEE